MGGFPWFPTQYLGMFLVKHYMYVQVLWRKTYFTHTLCSLGHWSSYLFCYCFGFYNSMSGTSWKSYYLTQWGIYPIKNDIKTDSWLFFTLSITLGVSYLIVRGDSSQWCTSPFYLHRERTFLFFITFLLPWRVGEILNKSNNRKMESIFWFLSPNLCNIVIFKVKYAP